MPDLYLRRDRSALGRGEIFRPRRRAPRWLLSLTGFTVLAAALVFWQMNTIQPAVLALIGVRSTPTPTLLESARQGDLAFWRGNLTASIDHYRKAFALDPANVDIGYELIRMLIYRSYDDERNRSDIAEAVALAEDLLTANPSNSRAHAIHCYALLRSGQAEAATQSCQQAIRLNGEDPNPYAYLALAYYDLSRYDVAFEAATQALQRDPDGIESNTAYAFLLAASRQPDAAIEHFKKAAARNPRLEFPYFNLAINALGVGLARGDQALTLLAINAYDTVLSLNKRSVKAYTSLCRAYFSQGERNLARDSCRTAVDLDPTYTPAWRWLGEIDYRTAEYEGAIRALSECNAREKDLPPTVRQSACWYFLGLAYVQSGQCERALPIFADMLTWTRETNAVSLANKGAAICGGLPQTAPTPTSGP